MESAAVRDFTAARAEVSGTPAEHESWPQMTSQAPAISGGRSRSLARKNALPAVEAKGTFIFPADCIATPPWYACSAFYGLR